MQTQSSYSPAGEQPLPNRHHRDLFTWWRKATTRCHSVPPSPPNTPGASRALRHGPAKFIAFSEHKSLGW